MFNTHQPYNVKIFIRRHLTGNGFSDLEGFLHHHVSCPHQEMHKNIFAAMSDLNFTGTDIEVGFWAIKIGSLLLITGPKNRSDVIVIHRKHDHLSQCGLNQLLNHIYLQSLVAPHMS